MRISDYKKAGWRIEEQDNASDEYLIITPEGDCFSYYDLTHGICPVCSRLDEELITSEICPGHEEKLQKRINQANKLAELIMYGELRFKKQ